VSLFGRSFVLLWHGQIVSQLGNQAFLIATAYFALDTTGSTTVVAAVMMASTVPLVLLSPIGGTIADHHSRRRILIATDLLRALAVGGLAVFVLAHREVTTAHIALLITTATFNGVMAALFTPAVQAIIPDLVRENRLASANSLSQFSTQATILVGQAVGGVLYAQWGAAGLLLFDALSFGYAALVTRFIPADRKKPRQTISLRRSLTNYVIETTDGLRFVRRQLGMVQLLVTFAGVNFLFMPIFVLLPLYVRTSLAAGVEWYGFLLAGSGGGALCGAALAGVFLSHGRTNTRMLAMCVAAIAAAVLVVSATSVAWIAFIAFVAVGIFSAMINVIVITMFQTSVPADLRGRVMAVVVALSTAAVPLGMGLGGVMGDVWRDSLRTIFAACGVAMAILMLVQIRATSFSSGNTARKKTMADF
jgi:DHA3 family macrolide efflux protein-like MFS transporter